MMKYIDLFLSNVKNKPQEVFTGSCIFFTAVLGTSVHNVASTAFALMLIASFFIIKDWSFTWKQLSKYEKWLLICFGLYAASGVIAFINVQDVHEYIKELERYLRFLAAVPIYLFVRKYKINAIKYIYAGAIASGPFMFYVAIQSYMANPQLPAQGQYHQTLFGSLAMLNVGVMLAILLTQNLGKLLKLLILATLICGFIAVVLSQSRGVWLVIPAYIIIALYYAVRYQKVNLSTVLLIVALISGAVAISPIANMIKSRVSAAVENVSDFYSNDQYTSSLGARLAMWSIAANSWKKHPVIGSGPGNFDNTISALQKKGKYVGMNVFNSVHNIYFQSLFNAGIIGFLTLILGIIYMPLKIMFACRLVVKDISLVGIITVLLFSITGLSMSWIIRSPPVAIYILYMVTIVSSLHYFIDNSDEVEYEQVI